MKSEDQLRKMAILQFLEAARLNACDQYKKSYMKCIDKKYHRFETCYLRNFNKFLTCSIKIN